MSPEFRTSSNLWFITAILQKTQQNKLLSCYHTGLRHFTYDTLFYFNQLNDEIYLTMLNQAVILLLLGWTVHLSLSWTAWRELSDHTQGADNSNKILSVHKFSTDNCIPFLRLHECLVVAITLVCITIDLSRLFTKFRGNYVPHGAAK